MNLLLISADQARTDQPITISGRQHQHIKKVLRKNEGDPLQIGIVDGDIYQATITRIDSDHTQVVLGEPSPAPAALPCTLIMAMPRPKMLRRVLQTVSAMGVKEIYLINSYKVEKSFWQTPFLEPDAVNEQLLLGLEQAKDTCMQTLHIKKLFKPFVEDELPGIIGNHKAYIAHPRVDGYCPNPSDEQQTVVIGPEGGFSDYEVDKLIEAGCTAFTLGPRILRVENAVPVILAKLFK